MKKYLVKYDSVKNGKEYKDLEKIVDAHNIYEAISKVETDCQTLYASCSIYSLEEIEQIEEPK